MSYDVTPAPPGADPEKWAAHEAGSCGGYYRCSFCAAIVGRAKDAEAASSSSRPLTREERAQDRARLERRRAKAKAAKRARKLQRRRSR